MPAAAEISTAPSGSHSGLLHAQRVTEEQGRDWIKGRNGRAIMQGDPREARDKRLSNIITQESPSASVMPPFTHPHTHIIPTDTHTIQSAYIYRRTKMHYSCALARITNTRHTHAEPHNSTSASRHYITLHTEKHNAHFPTH